MKKHQTLEELVKERGLKPSEEKRRKTKNGYSYVCIHNNDDKTYYTLRHYPAIDRFLEVVLVRG